MALLITKRDATLYVVWKGLLDAIFVLLKPEMWSMISEANSSSFGSLMLSY